ncbi:DUF3604 domain-containing protein [Denitratisoma oestradiolicum]|uniref:DUF3604 domain-containing protein n=1 Tax=Denitratisoma oestradiolicum TaxID=311182 RepID=A0A6S6XV20_9PROT|nr:DUF3604 domain-containing protein [Denitratisoma oestradiolicum]TWO78753.1 hypothetical protein CBW56_18440 [Denitratisoma oestradiolicum]CAB1369884.1 exported protein of unknown function [Denitratisoma oestradiolicum]
MRWLLLTGSAALLLACSMPPEETTALNPDARAPAPEINKDGLSPEDRRALFGDTHLHTSYSFDAYGFSASRTDPDMAYRFAQGKLIDYLGI